MPEDKTSVQPNGCRAAGTARCALFAAVPGLFMAVVAAMNANALAIQADLALTILDAVALAAAWAMAEYRDRHEDSLRVSRAEAWVGALVAICMAISMTVVAIVAARRILGGGLAPSGPGVWLSILLNAGYGAINLWILNRWQARGRVAPSALVRSQVALFADKLSSNVLIASSLLASAMLEGNPIAAFIDPVASLMIAAATARWALPVIAESMRGFPIGDRVP